MRILVTNDDGIHAPGLQVLENIARALTDDVWVIAPETDQSGVSHSLSLSDPLRLRQITPRRFAVKGTPTDCVIMGIKHVMADALPDLVLSGVNHGQNVAEDVTYSGTIAAAMEGTLLGVRSIALSQAYEARERDTVAWACAEAHGPALLRKLLDQDLPPGILLNVNFPCVPPDQVAGIAVTVQGRRNQELMRIDPRTDSRGRAYFWIGFGRGPVEAAHGTDLLALRENRISVTPLELDLTHEPTLTYLAQALR